MKTNRSMNEIIVRILIDREYNFELNEDWNLDEMKSIFSWS